MGTNLVNVYSIVQQFQWSLDNKEFIENLWFDKSGNVIPYDPIIKHDTREIFQKTTVFIITLGLSEVWSNNQPNDIYWTALPNGKYSEHFQKFRVCSFEETKACIKETHRLITKYVPNAKVIFTLSPIRLMATFRNQSCITANDASKAILRAALDEYFRECEGYNESIFYFPSYELVNEFPNRYEDDGRHILPAILQGMMRLFEAYYCETSLNSLQVEEEVRDLKLQSANNWK